MNRILVCICVFLSVMQLGVSQTYPCDYDIELTDIDTNLKVNIEYPANLEMGDPFCAVFSVTTFEYVIGMEFQIQYDPSVIEIDCNNPSNISEGNCIDNVQFNCNNGSINVLYFNSNVEGSCCNDGSTLFTLCFTVIGEPLDDIFIDIDANEISWGLDIFTNDYIIQDSLCVNSTITQVECPDLTILTGFCYPTQGNNDGSFHFTACGGVAPYSYEVTVLGMPTDIIQGGTIDTDGEEISVDGLQIEGYLITITDANNETTTQIVFLDQEGNQIDFDILGTEPTCFDRQNGTVEITNITGGQPNYQFFWSNNEFGADNIDKLTNGTYSVTVEDSNGCSDAATVILALDTLKLNYTLLDSASCFGANNASIMLTAEGGRPFTTSPNTYLFNTDNTPLPDALVTGLEGGDFFEISVRDNPDGSCRVDSIIEIPYKEGFEVIELPYDGIKCNGDRLESIELFATVVTSVTAILRDEDGFMITDPSISSTTIGGTTVLLENIPAGNYLVDIEAFAPNDLSGCIVRYELAITEPDPLIFTLDDITPPDCGGNLGSIQYTLSGGGGNFDVSLNGAPIPSAQDINLGNDMYQIIELDGGMYELTVRDDNDCIETLMFDLPPAGTLPLEILTLINLECGGPDDAALLVRVTGGCDNCDYIWQDEDGNIIGGGTNLLNLGQGCYTAVVTDNDQMCTNEITTCLTQVDGIEITESLTSPRCTEGTDGTIGIIIDQGQAPITYQWADFPLVTGSVIGPIAAGNYCVTITDANMCEIISCIDLLDPDSLSMSIVNIIPAACNGQASGQIDVTGLNGFGGTDFYSYIIYDASGAEYTTGSGTGTVSITDLEAGSYTALVTDGQCAALEEIAFIIDEPVSINVDLDNSVIVDPTCFGLCNGQISVNATGGTGSGYSYSWAATGEVSPSISGLCGDIWHYVDIMDSDGCVNRDSIFLTQPDTLFSQVNPIATQNPRCFEGTGGFITLNTFGGTPDYDYEWDNSMSIINYAGGLSRGTYNVTVTDVNGCEAFTSYTLTSPDPVTADFAIPLEPACFGEQTCVTVDEAYGGSEMGYTFSLSVGGFPYPLDSCVNVLADMYTITVFDSNGCNTDTTLVINQPDPIMVELGEDFLEVSLGDSSAVLQASISASNPVTIEWLPMDGIDCIDPSCQIVNVFPTSAQLYEVLVTDINGCTATDDIQITLGENRNVYIPNIFSPNGDGYNDGFTVFVGEGVRAVEYFGIFDRWGNIVYEAENIPFDQASLIKWDGKFKGKEVVPGVYAYRSTVSFVDDIEKEYKGSFTLLR